MVPFTLEPRLPHRSDILDADAIARMMAAADRWLIMPVDEAPLPAVVERLANLALCWAQADVTTEEKRAAALLLLNVAGAHLGQPPSIGLYRHDDSTVLVIDRDAAAVPGSNAVN
ncbi:MAG: hypothetical protein ACOCYE_04940 [Pseudomonadota bacterium]